MAMAFSITMPLPADLQGSADVAANVRGTIARSGRRSMERIAADAKGHTPWQHVAEGYHVEQNTAGGAQVELSIVNDAPEWQWTEFGRAPGKQPPMQAIQGWADAHGLSAYAFVIARAIGRRGLPAHHILSDAWDRGLPAAVDDLSASMGRLLASWGAREG